MSAVILTLGVIHRLSACCDLCTPNFHSACSFDLVCTNCLRSDDCGRAYLDCSVYVLQRRPTLNKLLTFVYKIEALVTRRLRSARLTCRAPRAGGGVYFLHIEKVVCIRLIVARQRPLNQKSHSQQKLRTHTLKTVSWPNPENRRDFVVKETRAQLTSDIFMTLDLFFDIEKMFVS